MSSSYSKDKFIMTMTQINKSSLGGGTEQEMTVILIFEDMDDATNTMFEKAHVYSTSLYSGTMTPNNAKRSISDNRAFIA